MEGDLILMVVQIQMGLEGLTQMVDPTQMDLEEQIRMVLEDLTLMVQEGQIVMEGPIQVRGEAEELEQTQTEGHL